MLRNKLEDSCQVLPALHTLSGFDVTGKVGTKLEALKADPLVYLTHFGVNPNLPNLEEIFQQANEMIKIYALLCSLKRTI